MHGRILYAFRIQCSNISSSDNCCVCSAGRSPVGNSDQVLGEDAKARKKKKENENNDHTPPMHALCIHGTIKQV